MSQKRALQIDDDILNLLTGDGVTFLITPTKLSAVLIILGVNLVITTGK